MATKELKIEVIDSCQVTAVTPVDSWNAAGINAAYATAIKSLEKAAEAVYAERIASSEANKNVVYAIFELRLSNIAHQLINEEIHIDGVRGTATLLSSASWATSSGF